MSNPTVDQPRVCNRSHIRVSQGNQVLVVVFHTRWDAEMTVLVRSALFYVVVSSGMMVASLAQGQPPSQLDAFQFAIGSGIPNDWTMRHLIFSSSQDTGDVSISRKDPRYWLQQLRRRGSQAIGSAEAADASIAAARLSRPHEEKPRARESVNSRWRNRDTGDFEDHGSQIWPRIPLERDWSESLGVLAVSTIRYPAKFSFSTSNPTPDCTNDYVVVTQSGGGGTFPGTFNIIGFNNLYVSTAGGSQFCSGTAPKAIFEYNASSASGALNGAPALSLDGTLIAFVETASVANGGAVFHVLKWHSGDVQNVESLFPAAFNTSALPSCVTNGATAPCEYNLQYTPSALRTTANRTAPFVDYSSDTAYVSDDGGNIYAITPVFSASPTSPPAVAVGWPVNVGTVVGLVAPVYDSSSKNVFVGTILGKEYFIKTAGSTTGSCLAGSVPCVGSTTFSFGASSAIGDATVVDSSNGRVYFTGRRAGGTPGSFLVQADTQLSAASIVIGTIGTAGTSTIYSGTPDNDYFVNISAGKFYVCGVDINSDAQLYAFGFNGSGVMNTTAVGGPLQLGNAGSTNASCSTGPTEIFNQSNNKDWVFVGLGGRCAGATAGTTGCVMSLDVTSGFPATVSSRLVETNATSGIIVDNETDASASSITTDVYFHVTGPQSCLDYRGSAHSATCLVSATQSGLQ
jgi:hypothetical protein